MSRPLSSVEQSNEERTTSMLPGNTSYSPDPPKRVCKTCGILVFSDFSNHWNVCQKYCFWKISTSPAKPLKNIDSDRRVYLKHFLNVYYRILDKQQIKSHVQQYGEGIKPAFNWKEFLVDNTQEPSTSHAQDSSENTKKTLQLPPALQCEFCTKTHHHEAELLACYREHAAVEMSRYYMCQECELLFSLEHLYIAHIRLFQKQFGAKDSRHNNYSCEICGLMFTDYAACCAHRTNRCEFLSIWLVGEESLPQSPKLWLPKSPSLSIEETLLYYRNFLSAYDTVVKNYKSRISTSLEDEVEVLTLVPEESIDEQSNPLVPEVRESKPEAPKGYASASKSPASAKRTNRKRPADINLYKPSSARIGISQDGKGTLSVFKSNTKDRSKHCEFCFTTPKRLTECYAKHCHAASIRYRICEKCDCLFDKFESFKTHMTVHQ